MTEIITTAEELDALPIRSVAIDEDGDASLPPTCQPSREQIAHALHVASGDLIGMDFADIGVFQAKFLREADAAIALLPGRSEAEVKAEALREAADAYRHFNLPESDRTAAFLKARADRLAGGEQ